MYNVEWLLSTVGELADLWNRADSTLQDSIGRAADLLDEQLRVDPFAQSESRPDDDRVCFEFPLGITFRLEPDGRTITILRVWLVHKPPKK